MFNGANKLITVIQNSACIPVSLIIHYGLKLNICIFNGAYSLCCFLALNKRLHQTQQNSECLHVLCIHRTLWNGSLMQEDLSALCARGRTSELCPPASDMKICLKDRPIMSHCLCSLISFYGYLAGVEQMQNIQTFLSCKRVMGNLLLTKAFWVAIVTRKLWHI